MANISVRASVIPDCVEMMSGVSSSVYPLPAMVANYLALVVTEGILTRWAEDGQNAFVGLVDNSTCRLITDSGLLALHALPSGSYQ